MKEIFGSIYSDCLALTLLFSREYVDLSKLTSIKENLLNIDTINKFFAIFKTFQDENNFILIDNEHKNSLYSILNDIRYDYKFQNLNERETIINEVNNCIIKINSMDVENGSDLSTKEIIALEQLNFDMLVKEFEFLIIHYYLQDEEIFMNEGIPLYEINPDLYVEAVYNLVNEYPILLSDQNFLKRTKIVTDRCIKYIQDNLDCFDKNIKVKTLSLLKKMNNVIIPK